VSRQCYRQERNPSQGLIFARLATDVVALEDVRHSFSFQDKSGSQLFPFLDSAHCLCQNVELFEPSLAAVIQPFFDLLQTPVCFSALRMSVPALQAFCKNRLSTEQKM
jgi:hypothetical protein